MNDLRTAAQQALEALTSRDGDGWTRRFARDRAIEALEAALAEPAQEPVAWLRVIDEAMVMHHLGVADPGDDYETAKRKMNVLLCMAQDIGTYFAKQAEPVEPVEPVAWRWGYRSVTTGEMDWRGYVEIAAHPNLRSPEIIMEPLYAAPPQRKPLTEEEIPELAEKVLKPSVYYDAEALLGRDGLVALVRAVERAHGIKE